MAVDSRIARAAAQMLASDSRTGKTAAQMLAAANNYSVRNKKKINSEQLPEGLLNEYITQWSTTQHPGNQAVAAVPDAVRLNNEVGYKQIVSRLGSSSPIASPAPQPSESRGQLRVDLDTSPVQTKDSVMYRNAGEGEDSTIGEASRPNKRKPGLSSNLGINL